MLEKQTWIYLLINCIVTTAILLILFRFQENKIKTLLKKHEKYNKRNDTKNTNNLESGYIKDDIQYTQTTENTENTENENENDNKFNNDIDSFIDPIDNNN